MALRVTLRVTSRDLKISDLGSMTFPHRNIFEHSLVILAQGHQGDILT